MLLLNKPTLYMTASWLAIESVLEVQLILRLVCDASGGWMGSGVGQQG